MLSIFELAEEKEVTLRMTKAQKCMDRLRTSLKGNPAFVPYVSLSSVKQSSPSEDTFVERANKMVQESRNAIRDRVLMQKDLAHLKDTIYTKNHEIGLDKVLTRATLVNSYLATLKQLETSMENGYQYTTDELKGIYNKKVSSTMYIEPEIVHSSFDPEVLKEEIKRLSFEADNLEDKRDGLNARHKITLKLSLCTIEFLGLTVNKE